MKAAISRIGDLILVQLTHFNCNPAIDQEVRRYVAVRFVDDVEKSEMAKIFSRKFFRVVQYIAPKIAAANCAGNIIFLS